MRASGSLGRRLAAAAALASVTCGLLTAAQPAAAAARPHAPRVQLGQASRDLGHLAARPGRKPSQGREARPSGVRWPAARVSTARLARPAVLPVTAGMRPLAPALFGSAGTVSVAPGTPVWALRSAAVSSAGPSAVTVRLLSHQSAAAAGVRGILFTAAASGGGGQVRLGVDYRSFAGIYGGNYGLSLRLAELPACALTTPRRAACRQQRPLPSVNNAAARSVSALVGLPRPARSVTSMSAQATEAAQPGTVVLAATPASYDGGGPAGTYSATSLKPAGTWTGGGSSGSFTYSYPIAVPPAASSLVPSLALNYDSGSVDGQTAATQAQSSWAGDGWSTPQAFIEQTFTPCSDDPEGSASPVSTADECYDGPVLTLSLDGQSTPLVCPAPFSYTVTSTCVPSDDDGAVVTHVVSSGNGVQDKFTDYWTVTTRDGTTYEFGRNELPGWASGDKATSSVQTMPVYSAHSGDPCYSSSGFSSSVCTMAYRWNLDYVTDSLGNAMAYYYDQATNAYAEDGNTASATSYVRDAWLDHIDYGFTAGNAYSGHAPDEVAFGTGDRCFTGTCDPLSSSTAANWMDVPYYENCAAQASCEVVDPTFWSTVALNTITTQQWNGSTYTPVDTWTLGEKYLPTNDGTSPTLWLQSITRKGSDTTAGGSAVTLPSVSFSAIDLANRLNPNSNYPALDRERIAAITTETGSVISVNYGQPEPCSTTSLPSPASNVTSCFPVYWQQFSPPDPDWFIKYAVTSVSQTDPSGGSPGTYTSYQYASPAWHYDDNEVVEAKYRTYGQWRGFQDVKTFTGTGGDAQTESQSTYYQGMSDDNNSTAVNLPDSQKGQHPDLDQLAGDLLEHTDYNFSGGPVEDSQIYSYWVSGNVASRTRSGLPALTANATGQVEEWTRQAITDSSPTTWRDTETDTSYEATPGDPAFGLPQHVYSHGDLSQPAQETCTTDTYAAVNTTANIAGLLSEQQVDALACGGPDPDGATVPTAAETNALTLPSGITQATVISDTRTYYDDPPVISGGLAVPGNTTWPQAAPGNSEPSVTEKATAYNSGTGVFTYQTTAATAYDTYGRPVASYDGNGNKTGTAYTMTNGVTTAVKVTNPLGQAVTTTYDPLRGLPTAVTDANSVTTTEHYDGLGRLTGVWEYSRPTTGPANYVYTYAIGTSTTPTVVTTEAMNDESEYVTSTTLYDALMRVRQTQVPTPQGGILVSDSFYDSRGWLWKSNINYWDSSASAGSSVITVPDDQVPDQDVTAFDGLGRPVLVTSYDDSAAKSTTATAYYGDRVTTVPASGGTPTSTVTDALGRTTEIDQYTTAPAVTTSVANNITTVTIAGGTSQATSYAYNTRGELGTITDDSQQWTDTYNLLGQVSGSTEPDGGSTTSMLYDDDGNLTSATNADGHTISYTYDALSRKTGEYDGSTSASPPIATWTYDNSNKAVTGMTYPIGQLTTQTSYDASGRAYTLQQKNFNVFGESTGETWTMPSGDTSLGALDTSYTLTNTYTATTGLPYHVLYPASPGGGALPAETLTYGYSTAFDLPNTVGSNLDGYDQDTTYSAWSQVAQQQLGTPTSPDYAYVSSAYDPHTGAMTSTQVANTAISATPYDATTYTYDPSGNITSQTDTRNGTQTEQQCYNYNTLDELTQAWTTSGTPACSSGPSTGTGGTVGDGITGSAYWTQWAYNPLGDQTSETDNSVTGGTATTTSYTYNGNGKNQPNTLTSSATTGGTTASASYAYDTAGNTTAINQPSGDQALTWNDNGTLRSDAVAGNTTSYVYDTDGNVLLQQDPGTTTLYIFGEQLTLNTSTGAVTGTRFIQLPGGGEVVRTGTGSSYQFELANQQNTGILTLNDNAQSPSWRQFTPYGSPRGTAPPSWPDTNGFLGKPTDANTGLTVIGARQYDPATGRFISLDPLLETTSPLQLNGYSYAADNPATNADPSGQCAKGDGGQAVNCSGTPVATTPVTTSNCPSSVPGCPGYQAPASGGGCDSNCTRDAVFGGLIDAGARTIDAAQNAATQGQAQTDLGGQWDSYWTNQTGNQNNPAFATTMAASSLGITIAASLIPGDEDEAAVGLGVILDDGAEDTTRVGRWMSQNEFDKMSSTGRVQEGAGGRTYVVTPPDPATYSGTGAGSIYAEFDVPSSVLFPGGGNPDYRVIPGPNVTTTRFGPGPFEMPSATCIVWVCSK